jgi:transposase
MPEKTYPVRLTKKQRRTLEPLTHKSTHSVRTVKRARILLLAHDNVTNQNIMKCVEVSRSTPLNIRRRFQTLGINVIFKQQRPGRAPKFNPETRANITALACTTPPEGFGQWSYRLLADKAVELGFVDTIHFDTIGEILKKTSCNHNGSEAGASVA